jgi:hypothetical protein
MGLGTAALMEGLNDPQQITRDQAAIAEQRAEWLRELAYFEIIHLGLRAWDVELVADLSNQILFMIPTAREKAQKDCWFPSEELKGIRHLHREVTFKLGPELFVGIRQERRVQHMIKRHAECSPRYEMQSDRAELDRRVQELMNQGTKLRAACNKVAESYRTPFLLREVSGRTIERLLKS